MRTKARRRTYDVQRKLKVMNILKTRLNRDPSPDEIGKAASVHCRDCSCSMCGNPRNHFNQKTVKERSLESIESILRDVI